MPRSAPSPAQPRASPRRRGGQRLETYPGSCWESLALPEVPGLPFASIAEPPRPPTPDTPSPTAKRSAAAAGSEPQISVPPPPPPPPARRLRSSASAEPGQRREPVTRGLGSAQPRRLAHPPSPPPRPIPTSPPPPPHPHLLLLPLLRAHEGRSSRTSCNQCGDVTHPVRFPRLFARAHSAPRGSGTHRGRRASPKTRGGGPRQPGGEPGSAPRVGSDHMGWVWGRGRSGELCPGCSPGGEAAAPRTPIVCATHSSSWAPAPDAEVAPAACPASVPRFPATSRKFRSRTPGAPTPSAPGAVPETPGIGEASGWRRPSRTNTSHKFSFSLRAASSLAPAPHRHVLHGSPPFPGRGTEPCPRRLFWNFKKQARYQGARKHPRQGLSVTQTTT